MSSSTSRAKPKMDLVQEVSASPQEKQKDPENVFGKKTLTGAEIVIQALVDNGVDTIF